MWSKTYNVHEIIDADGTDLWHHLTSFVQELTNGVALLDLSVHSSCKCEHCPSSKRDVLLTSTSLRCPLPSQYEKMIVILSSLIASCLTSHNCRNSSRSLRSASSRSRSGKNSVLTSGFLPSFARLGARSVSSSSSAGSSSAKDSFDFLVSFFFFFFFRSSSL